MPTSDIGSQASGFFKIKTLDSFIPDTIQVALSIGALLSLVYLIWGGIQYLSSGGDQESTKVAKSKITQAIFGLGILASIWVIWRLIIYFLGLSSTPSGTFTLEFPNNLI